MIPLQVDKETPSPTASPQRRASHVTADMDTSNGMSDVCSSETDELMTSTGLSEGPNWDYYQVLCCLLPSHFFHPIFS